MKWMKDNGLRLAMWICGLVLLAMGGMSAFGVFKGSMSARVEHNHEAITGVKAELKDEIRPGLTRAIKHVDQEEIDTPRIKADIKDIKTDFRSFKGQMEEAHREQQTLSLQVIEALNRIPQKP